MFHLLPEAEKKVLKKEYYYRLAILVMCFLIATAIISSAFLFPSYVLSKKRLEGIMQANEEKKTQIQSKTDPEMSDFLSSLQSNLVALQPSAHAASSSFYIKKITDKKTNGILIDQFSITYDDSMNIFVKGNADTREHLTFFFRDLQAIPDFSRVDLPISDFAKDKDIDFNITVNVKKK